MKNEIKKKEIYCFKANYKPKYYIEYYIKKKLKF